MAFPGGGLANASEPDFLKLAPAVFYREACSPSAVATRSKRLGSRGRSRRTLPNKGQRRRRPAQRPLGKESFLYRLDDLRPRGCCLAREEDICPQVFGDDVCFSLLNESRNLEASSDRVIPIHESHERFQHRPGSHTSSGFVRSVSTSWRGRKASDPLAMASTPAKGILSGSSFGFLCRALHHRREAYFLFC